MPTILRTRGAVQRADHAGVDLFEEPLRDAQPGLTVAAGVASGSLAALHQVWIMVRAFEQEALASMIWANQARNTGMAAKWPRRLVGSIPAIQSAGQHGLEEPGVAGERSAPGVVAEKLDRRLRGALGAALQVLGKSRQERLFFVHARSCLPAGFPTVFCSEKLTIKGLVHVPFWPDPFEYDRPRHAGKSAAEPLR